MKIRLKPVEEQVIVITGGSSGIGLTTARMAAERGAKVVLAARDEDGLRTVEQEIARRGGTALTVVADVADEADVRKVADAAVQRFGAFDTWVNNAGVSIFGKIADVPVDDLRRLFDTNFWGVVHGSLVAQKHLRDGGGALINIGSVASDQAIPLQGIYSASKHAVKGFTDALRMELESDGAPVSVTLIKPTSIDTPYELHARNYLDREPTLPPPVYAPELVAEAILHAAEHRVRDLIVGGAGKAMSMMGRRPSRLGDRMMKGMMDMQRRGEPASDRPDSLYGPSGDGRTRSGRHAHVRERSFYTRSAMHPVVTVTLLAGLAAMAVGVVAAAGRSSGHPRSDGHRPTRPYPTADRMTLFPAPEDRQVDRPY